jgi:hypothetical protein
MIADHWTVYLTYEQQISILKVDHGGFSESVYEQL